MMKYGKRADKRLKCVLQCCKVCLLEAMALRSCSAHINSRTENTGANVTIADNGYMHITGSMNTICRPVSQEPNDHPKKFQ